MKKYLPVTYVDGNGVCWTKESLTNKLYKRNEREISERKDEYTGNTYVYTIQRIENVRDAPTQKSLFENT